MAFSYSLKETEMDSSQDSSPVVLNINVHIGLDMVGQLVGEILLHLLYPNLIVFTLRHSLIEIRTRFRNIPL